MTETPDGRRTRRPRRPRRPRGWHAVVESVPFLTRTLAPFEVLSEEGLALIEENADTILEQVGIDFRDTPDALELFAGRRRRRRRRARALPARARAVSSSRRPRRASSPRSRGTRRTTS